MQPNGIMPPKKPILKVSPSQQIEIQKAWARKKFWRTLPINMLINAVICTLFALAFAFVVGIPLVYAPIFGTLLVLRVLISDYYFGNSECEDFPQWFAREWLEASALSKARVPPAEQSVQKTPEPIVEQLDMPPTALNNEAQARTSPSPRT